MTEVFAFYGTGQFQFQFLSCEKSPKSKLLKKHFAENTKAFSVFFTPTFKFTSKQLEGSSYSSASCFISLEIPGKLISSIEPSEIC